MPLSLSLQPSKAFTSGVPGALLGRVCVWPRSPSLTVYKERELFLFLGVETEARKFQNPSQDLDGRGQGFSSGLAGRQVPPTLNGDALWLHPVGGPLVATWCSPSQPTLLFT